MNDTARQEARNTPDLERALDRAELAEILNVSERTTQRLERAGILPARLPIPGRARWARAAVRAWMAGSTGARLGRR